MPAKGATAGGATSFGELLRSLRESASLSQEELAERAHLTVHAVSALERGVRTRPYPSTVRSLADALDLSDGERVRLSAAVPARGRGTSASAAPTEIQSGASSSATSLPAPPTRLVARDRELDELGERLRNPATRLVTVTGLGGVGKTRISIALAQRLDGSFPGGLVFVPLAPVLDTELVPAAIADAVGVDLGDGTDPVGGLVAALADRELLLVLDNFEHLLGAALSVSRLLEGCPRLTVLVTSRSVLRLRGEHEFALQPLAVPSGEVTAETVAVSPAATLFLERAAEVSGFTVSGPADAAAVASICTRLAGIPLALELAAARTRSLDPAALLARLDDAVDLDGARDLPARQRTLRATLDWSYGLLDEPERVLLRHLAVFTGGFTLPDVEAVVAATRAVPAGRVLELLSSLVEQSLVTVAASAAPRRFALLEPVAQYARSLLEPEEAGRAEQAHLRHFLALAEQAAPEYEREQQVWWLHRIDAEQANLTAAVERATAGGDGDAAGRLGWALWLYWWMRGHALLGSRLVTAALELDLQDDVRPRAQIAAAALAFRLGDVPASRRWWEAGLASAEQVDDRLSQANAVAGVGLAALAAGDLAEAECCFDRALPPAQQAGARGEWLHGLVHVWLGTVALLQGDPERARELVEIGLESARRRGDALSAYIALYNLSQVALSQGQPTAARPHLLEGMQLSLRTGDLANLGYFCDALAVVESALGRHERVPVLLGAGQGIRETVGRLTYGYYQPEENARDAAAAAAGAALGPDAYDDGVDRGRAMGDADIVGFAAS